MSSPELYIKSLREPLVISSEEADVITRVLADDSKNDDTPIIIEGVWSGKKGQVKYVSYPKKESSEDNRKRVEPMAKKKAEEFEKTVSQHQAEAEAAGFATFNWDLFYLQARKAIRIDFTESIFGTRLVPVVTDPVLFPFVQEEIDSYNLYLARKQYAEKMRLKELEKLAKDQPVENPPNY